MTSPSPEEARAQLLAIIADAFVCAWEEHPNLAFSDYHAVVCLDAALAARTEPKTCETCGGTGDTAPFTRELTHPCPTCDGSGSRSLYLLDVIRKGE